MDRNEELRRFPRMSTGSDYRAHFELPGFGLVRALVQNLSACGCGLQVEMTDMKELNNGCYLYALFLDHPSLPYLPLEGKVMRVLGKVPGKSEGYALVGVEFHAITPFVQGLINDHVLSQTQQG